MTQEAHPSTEGQLENPLVGIKVVLNILEEAVLIGISRGAVISPHDDIQATLAVVPEALARARERWERQPNFPAYHAPATAAPTPRAGRQTTTKGRQGAGQQEERVRRPRMF